MIKNFKINTAVLICMAFVFRLLFVNIGIISSFYSKQNTNFINKCFSSTMKRRKSVDVVSNSTAHEYSINEICEENLNDEDDLSKANPFILIQSLYSFFANKLTSLRPNVLFDLLNFQLSLKKYLTISVLRI